MAAQAIAERLGDAIDATGHDAGVGHRHVRGDVFPKRGGSVNEAQGSRSRLIANECTQAGGWCV
jgi:hypothetical protein